MQGKLNEAKCVRSGPVVLCRVAPGPASRREGLQVFATENGRQKCQGAKNADPQNAQQKCTGTQDAKSLVIGQLFAILLMIPV